MARRGAMIILGGEKENMGVQKVHLDFKYPMPNLYQRQHNNMSFSL
jgi:hypothetical protein